MGKVKRGSGSSTLMVLAAGLLGGGLSGTGVAGVFDQADALFAQREGSSANVHAARADYEQIASAATGDDLAYCVQQIGRLAVYEGDYLLPADSGNDAARASLFDECRTYAKKLEGDQSHVNAYAFWRMACTAQWMQYATVADRLAQLSDTKAYFDKVVTDSLDIDAALGLDLSYQGGGMQRTLTAIYANQLSSLMRSTLPDGQKALAMANAALADPAYAGDPNAGADYYRNYRHKAIALAFLGDKADEASTLSDAIAEIQARASDDALPPGMEPETRAELALMQAMQAKLQAELPTKPTSRAP
jgi:hypothetical protein